MAQLHRRTLLAAVRARVPSILRRKAPRRAVYTCLFGYSEVFADRIYEADGETDFLCFTDDPTLRSEHWRVRYVNSAALGPVRTAKMVKLLAHRFVGDYEASLYIDNTVELAAPAAEIFSHLQTNPMVCFRHPDRDCVYDEARFVVEHGIDDAATITPQMNSYREAGHPEHAGLIAATMLLRRHSDPALQLVMEAWFQQVCLHSYRDQLSFDVVARRMRYRPDHFPEGTLYVNDLMKWPILSTGYRVPRGFRDEIYLLLNADVVNSGMTPREHYLKIGAAEGRLWQIAQEGAAAGQSARVRID